MFLFLVMTVYKGAKGVTEQSLMKICEGVKGVFVLTNDSI